MLGACELARSLKDKLYSGAKIDYIPSKKDIERFAGKLLPLINVNRDILEQVQEFYNEEYGNIRIIYFTTTNGSNNCINFRPVFLFLNFLNLYLEISSTLRI